MSKVSSGVHTALQRNQHLWNQHAALDVVIAWAQACYRGPAHRVLRAEVLFAHPRCSCTGKPVTPSVKATATLIHKATTNHRWRYSFPPSLPSPPFPAHILCGNHLSWAGATLEQTCGRTMMAALRQRSRPILLQIPRPYVMRSCFRTTRHREGCREA